MVKRASTNQQYKKYKHLIIPVTDGDVCDGSNSIFSSCKIPYCNMCLFAEVNKKTWAEWYNEKHRFDDLTKIDVPFGLLPEEVQKRLKDVYNGKNDDSNIEYLFEEYLFEPHDNNKWCFKRCKPLFSYRGVYRLRKTEKKVYAIDEAEKELSQLHDYPVEIRREKTT